MLNAARNGGAGILKTRNWLRPLASAAGLALAMASASPAALTRSAPATPAAPVVPAARAPRAAIDPAAEERWEDTVLNGADATAAGFTRELFDRDVQPAPAIAALFSSDDYPLTAVHSGQEGSVRVYLRIGADGQLKDCMVVESSGAPALDRQTCRIFWTRGKFIPAHDSQGRAVESASDKRITWKLANGEALPLSPWWRRTVLTGQKGEPLGCVEEASDGLDADQRECRVNAALWGGVARNAAERAAEAKSQLIIEMRCAPESTISPVRSPPE
jgi:TonB family protein